MRLLGFFCLLCGVSFGHCSSQENLLRSISYGYVSRGLLLVMQKDLVQILGKDTLCIEQIAKKMGVDEENLYLILSSLAKEGIFLETSGRHFANNALSYRLHQDHPHSLRQQVLLGYQHMETVFQSLEKNSPKS